MYRFLVLLSVLSILFPVPIRKMGRCLLMSFLVFSMVLLRNLAWLQLILQPPDKGSFFIAANNTRYEVVFNAALAAASNAILVFASDTILYDMNREFTNLGNDAIAYNPVRPNKIMVVFNDGRQVTGYFDPNTSFGGVWRSCYKPMAGSG